MIFTDSDLQLLLAGIFGLLIFASLIGQLIAKFRCNECNRKTIENLNQRINAWWMMSIVLLVAILIGTIGTLVLFICISFFALRECITLTPTKLGDHQALFWCFFIFLPIQYLLIGLNWYNFFAIFIPVFVFLFIATRIAINGNTVDFLGRVAKIQWSMMIAVYCISYIPALLLLNIDSYDGQNFKLIMFLVIVVQLSDVLQYVFGKLFGRHAIVPKLSPNKTVEGFIGGILSASLIGMSLWWITPFTFWQAGLVSTLITLLGFCGGLCMSAIKRDRGIKDFGTIIEGHGGMMDRIDSLCFAAPVFFHIINYFFG
ncbi:phosphatidate cytidylyltransferase [Orbus sturtevantii]|uniref:phosphatidate cytidylyltransferase n=1 Tax=Orbus sturtevantii TaxID=3074109 RepID=UPI00370DA8C2